MLNTPVPIATEFGGYGGTIGSLVSLIGTLAITFAGVIVLFLAVFGGIKIISSAGSGDARGSEQGKKALTYAAAGFIIVLVSFFILELLRIVFGVAILTNPALILQGNH